jgi:hypothetical protein
MGLFTHGPETRNDAASAHAAASFDIPMDAADDDEPMLVPPVGEDVVDPWAGVEAPVEEFQADVVAEVPHHTTEEEPVATIPREVEEPPEKGGWMVSILCAGIAVISICLLLPLAEENHQLAWQREKLKTDLVQLQQQVEINDQFLKKISNDPTLAERLAQRQMKFVREGSSILDLPVSGKEEMSPFQLVSLPNPAPIALYQPLGGAMSAVVRNPHLRLYLTGIGLLLLATGLVLGGESKQAEDAN